MTSNSLNAYLSKAFLLGISVFILFHTFVGGVSVIGTLTEGVQSPSNSREFFIVIWAYFSIFLSIFCIYLVYRYLSSSIRYNRVFYFSILEIFYLLAYAPVIYYGYSVESGDKVLVLAYILLIPFAVLIFASSYFLSRKEESREDIFTVPKPSKSVVIVPIVVGVFLSAIFFIPSSTDDDKSQDCWNFNGDYTGLYQGAGEAGSVRLEIERNCDYEVYLDGRRYGYGKFIKRDENTLVFENGNWARVRRNRVTAIESIYWVEETTQGKVVYEVDE